MHVWSFAPQRYSLATPWLTSKQLVAIRSLMVIVGMAATPGSWAQPALAAPKCSLEKLHALHQESGGAPSAADSTTVMVLLSPRMVYALQEWPRMRHVAQQAGFAVSAWRDPRVSKDEWREAVLSLGLPEMVSVPVLPPSVAAPCGLLAHAPSALVAHRGRVHPWPVHGVMPDAQWLAVLRSREQWLRVREQTMPALP